MMGKTSTNQRFEGNAEVDSQRARFAWLLDKFSAFAVTMPSGRNPDHSRTLPSPHQSGQVQAHAGASDRNRISTLLAGFREAEEHYRLEQEQCADDFNLLEVLKLTALADGAEQTFVDNLQSHFGIMAQLVPVLDTLFQEHPRSKRK